MTVHGMIPFPVLCSGSLSFPHGFSSFNLSLHIHKYIPIFIASNLKVAARGWMGGWVGDGGGGGVEGAMTSCIVTFPDQPKKSHYSGK